jgi:hypothetical protein
MTTKPKTHHPHKPKGHMQPTTPVLISIVNKSQKVSDAEVAAATPAFGAQIAEDFAPVWGSMCAVEFVPKGGTPNGNVIATLSDVPDVDGAYGYHDRDTNGYAFIKVFVIDGSDWRTTMSHEILETLGDAAVNRWRDAPDGNDDSEEMCDACENDTYDKNGVPVSDFVYPAYFNPTANAADRLDHLGLIKKPFSLRPGGYKNRRTEPGKISQVFARHKEMGHDVHVALQAHETTHGRAILVVFGENYPEEKKQGKINKARKKYAKAA